MKTKLHIIIFLLLGPVFGINAQIIPQKDTLPTPPPLPDSLLSITDSLKVATPTFELPKFEERPEFTKPSFQTGTPSPGDYKISESALDAAIDYTARDSQRLDAKNELVYLYGDAEVKYETMTLKADYIVFNLSDNIATAEGRRDSITRQWIGKPEFREGDQVFGAKKMRYNFKTGKGIIYSATTQQNDMHVLGEKTKFVGKNESRNQDKDYVYSSKAVITSCDHPDPHFGFRSRKIKVVPDEVAVSGPANLEIAGIGTPLWIPFGAFPLTKGKRGGLVRGEWEFSPSLGFGLLRWGWYFPMTDNYDVTVTADLYLRGSFRVYGNMRYNKRYKYTGSLALTFANLRNEVGLEKVNDRSIGIRWSHNQNPKAHPTRTFGGSLNIQTNDFQSQNLNDPNAVLENSLTSNVNYTQRFPGKPYTLTSSFNHSQNTRSRNITIQFPVVNFQMQQIYPFKSKKPSGPNEKWFEKISFRYSGKLQNTITATDTTLFRRQTLEDAKYGIKHDISSGASFRMFKHFNVNPNINFKEVWYFNYLEKEFDPTPTLDSTFINTNPNDPDEGFYKVDTTQFGSVEDMVKFGFKPLHLFDASISMTTKIFGTMQFRKGWLRGIRHVLTPNFGFSYTPDYTSDFFNYFGTVRTDSRDEENVFQQYTFFERGIFDRPSSGGRRMSLTYGFSNLFEGKYYSKKDSTEKKFKLFNSLNLNGNFNFAADSLKWSTVNISGNHSFFKGLTNFQLGIVLDPYIVDEDNRRINKTVLKEQGKLLRFDNARFNFSTSLSVSKIKEIFGNKNKSSSSSSNSDRDRDSGSGHTGFSTGGSPPPLESIVDDEAFIDWFDRFSMSHQLQMTISKVNGKDTFQIRTNNLSMRGSIPLTKKWNLTISNLSYDFNSKRFSYPALGFTRDLHCWLLDFRWYPETRTYTFSLRVKNSTLGFLKVPWQRNQYDGQQLQLGGF